MDYKDKRWLHKREVILKRDEYLCRECKKYGLSTEAQQVHHIYPCKEYPRYSMTNINLLSLCNTCHDTMHDRNNNTITVKGEHWQNKIRDALGVNDYDIIDKFKVVIVWGSPASGKTTYVNNHMVQGDMIVDLDNIKQAISLHGKADSLSNLLGVALDIRSHIYDLIDNRQVIQAKTVWVIEGLPKQTDRNFIKGKLRPNEMIQIKSCEEECINNAMNDDVRTDKNIQVNIIHKYFKDYEDPPT